MTRRHPLHTVIVLVLAALLALPAGALAAERPAARDASSARPDVIRRASSETIRVAPAGVVRITWTRAGIVDVDVRVHRGWRHAVERRGRDTVRVTFTDGQVAIVLTAHLTGDGELRTTLHRRDTVTDRRRAGA